MTDTILGTYLRELAKARDLSLYKMSVQVGIHASYMGQIISGKKVPTRATLRKIVQGLDLTGDDYYRLYFAAGYIPETSIPHAVSVAPEIADLLWDRRMERKGLE